MATPIPDNQARFALDELARICTGDWRDLDARNAEIVGVSTDSRSVPAGGLFVALAGERHDGHAFVPPALERGALALVARGRIRSGPRLEVDDPLAALGRIGRAWLERRRAEKDLPLLAVGGSAGKTSTKTLAAAAVRAGFGETLVTAGNLNNRIGVPMTLLTLTPAHRAAVIECGTSEPGEIAELGRILSPDVGLVTNVGIEHSEKLGSLVEIAEEEADLLRAAGRAAVTLADEPLLVERLTSVRAPRRLTFGLDPGADVRILGREPRAEGGSRIRFRLPGGEERSISTLLLGGSAALNLAAALAGCLALLGRPPGDEQLAAILDALTSVPPVPGRLRPLEAAGALVLDDTYNSNPASLRAALETAIELAAARRARLLLALGDMLELGDLAASSHDEMVRSASASGAAEVLLVGPESCAAATRAGRSGLRLYADSIAAAAAIPALVRPGDVLLVKGSRGIATERIVSALESDPPMTPE